MRVQTLIRGSLFMIAISVLVNVVSASRAAACSCEEPSVESSYNVSSDVALVDVRRSYAFGDSRYYVGYVARTFKGCLRARQRVILKTERGGDACGASPRLFRRYLINGTGSGEFLGTPVLSISLCSYDRQTSELTEPDLKFLEGRTVCCGEACSCADGSEPVQCLVDPCSVAPECAEVECVANYCGGCNAEFYGASGAAVCEASGGCRTDADCDEGWCRQVESDGTTRPSYECVPFIAEGERCDAFTVPWSYERCEPGLTCERWEYTAGELGVCLASCETSADCKDERYCDSDRLCDLDWSCEYEVDCSLPGNDVPHECVGHGMCNSDGTCGWECEDPQCVDLARLDLGPCDAVLGWAVIDGRCTELSGCTAGGFQLFQSREKCRETCGAPSCEDLAGIDFGRCGRLLGAAVVDGKCVEISGCSPRGHNIFDDVASCSAACRSE